MINIYIMPRSKSLTKRRSRKRSRSRSKKRTDRLLSISFCAKNADTENLKKIEKKLLKRRGIGLDGHDYGKSGTCLYLFVRNKGYNMSAVNNASRKYNIKMTILDSDIQF